MGESAACKILKQIVSVFFAPGGQGLDSIHEHYNLEVAHFEHYAKEEEEDRSDIALSLRVITAFF